MFGIVQMAIVDLWVYSQEVAHQQVPIHHVKRIYHQILLEIRSHRPEEGPHIHELIIKAVISFAVVHR